MRQFSIIATSRDSVVLGSLALEPGRNVFTVLTEDIDFVCSGLESKGVTIHSVNPMDQPPTTMSDMLLEGESLADVLGTGG